MIFDGINSVYNMSYTKENLRRFKINFSSQYIQVNILSSRLSLSWSTSVLKFLSISVQMQSSFKVNSSLFRHHETVWVFRNIWNKIRFFDSWSAGNRRRLLFDFRWASISSGTFASWPNSSLPTSLNQLPLIQQIC